AGLPAAAQQFRKHRPLANARQRCCRHPPCTASPRGRDGPTPAVPCFRSNVRHEEAAAFMACGYAKYTGKLGVCLATSSPGGSHLLNGLYDAKMDGQPVLAITGHHYHDLIDTFAQQDVDLDRVFEDVALYNTRVMGASLGASFVLVSEETARKEEIQRETPLWRGGAG